jgi:hypothetical protein
MTEHPYEDLAAFALGELDSDAADRVLRHADACAACAGILGESMRAVAALAEPDIPRESSIALKARSRRALFSWPVGVAAAAALLMAAWNVELRVTEPTLPVAALVHSHFAHHALTGAPGAAKLIYALDGSWVYVVADGLAPLRTYDLSVDGDRMGSLRADLFGRATAYWSRAPSTIKSATLVGPAGEALRWNGK